MIDINLAKNSVPTQIDLPKSKKGHRFVAYWLLGTVFTILIIAVIAYSVYKKEMNIAKEVSSKHKTVVQPVKTVVKKTDKKDKKIIKELENQDIPVFSLNIQLEDISKPDNKSTAAEEKKLPVINASLTNSKRCLKKQRSNEKVVLTVKVETNRFTKLKNMLKNMNIKYVTEKVIYKKVCRYDIFVGGFDSYSSIVKFSRDLKAKGYNIYKIVNLDLLFYVCIDRNVKEEKKVRYMDVWSKTTFKIIAKKHKKVYYRYKFTFDASQKDINLLKKNGYYPIILSQAKNGA